MICVQPRQAGVAISCSRPADGNDEDFSCVSEQQHTFPGHYSEERQGCWTCWWCNALVIHRGAPQHHEALWESEGTQSTSSREIRVMNDWTFRISASYMNVQQSAGSEESLSKMKYYSVCVSEHINSSRLMKKQKDYGRKCLSACSKCSCVGLSLVIILCFICIYEECLITSITGFSFRVFTVMKLFQHLTVELKIHL